MSRASSPPFLAAARAAAALHAQRRTPLAPCLFVALVCALDCFGTAAFTGAFFGFVSFLAACLALARSLTSRNAASRAAARTSGFWFRFALISSSDAPTTALVAALFT